MRTLKFVLMLMIVCFLTTTLLQAQRFKTYVLNAPEKRLEGVSKVAVLNFGNTSTFSSKEAGTDLGSKMADYITASLVNESRGANEAKTYIQGVRTNIYEVIERSRLDQVLKEQNLQVSGVIDDNQAVEIGQLLGLDALVLGSLSYSYKDEKDYSKFTDKKGNTTYTYSIVRTVTAEARMKIISIQTAEVLGTKNLSLTKKDRKTSNKGYPSYSSLTSPHQLADACYQSIAGGFANYFTPYFSYKSFNIKNIRIKEYKNRANDAEKYLKRGEIDPAYKLYKAIFDEDNYNPKAAYNLGVLYEAVGDYEQAFAQYDIAHQLDEDDKDYTNGYKRMERMKILVQELTAIGINIQKYEFAEGGSNILAKKLVTKGSKADRVLAYKDPNSGSEVLAKIPGGTEFAILEEASGFYLVKLLGGKQGYLYAKDVRAEK